MLGFAGSNANPHTLSQTFKVVGAWKAPWPALVSNWQPFHPGSCTAHYSHSALYYRLLATVLKQWYYHGDETLEAPYFDSGFEPIIDEC